MKVELGADFSIEHTGCTATARISSFDQHYYAFIIQDEKYDALYSQFSQYTSPIFILAKDHSPLLIHKAKENGIAGYFLKHEPPRLLVRAILNPSLRKFWMSERTEMNLETLPNLKRYLNLTAREQEIFAHLADGMTYKEVGHKLGITGKTVLSHREKLMKKMGFKGNSELIKEAIKLGITLL